MSGGLRMGPYEDNDNFRNGSSSAAGTTPIVTKGLKHTVRESNRPSSLEGAGSGSVGES